MCDNGNGPPCPIESSNVDVNVQRAHLGLYDHLDGQKMLDTVQGLEGRLSAIRMGKTQPTSGRSADPQVQAYSPLDDTSSDSDEDED